MSAIEFIMQGGMASVGGDMPDLEQNDCNSAIKIFGDEIRKYARQAQVPASYLSLFSSQYLFISKDTEMYSFIFAAKPGQDQIIYRDLSSHGKIPFPALIHQIRIEIGEVPWAFQIPINVVKTKDASLNQRIVQLAVSYIDTLLSTKNNTDNKTKDEAMNNPELSSFISKFRKDYPSSQKTAFIMMQFSKSKLHNEIISEVKRVLNKHNVIGLRADDKEYSDDLFTNIRTYMHCCDFGIAIFERLLEDDFNPNVSLEVGYMLGMDKRVCLLKDSTLKNLQSDLIGKLYKPFDTQEITKSIEPQLEKWMKDRGII